MINPLEQKIVILSQIEMDRFALWCEQHEESTRLLVEQTKKLGLHCEMLVKRLQIEKAGYQIMSQKLRSTEIMEV